MIVPLIFIALLFHVQWSTGILINFESVMRTPKLVTRYNYPLETHQMVTEDGYVLTHHRIPFGINNNIGNNTNNKGPVILMHGLCGSSSDWVLNDPSRALGFILADEGYDVWLMNSRGNTYSKKHRSISHLSPRFWDFSYHEIAVHDLADTIDYVLDVTGSDSVAHVGHSQGTTALYVLMGLKGREYGRKVKFHVSFAPIAYHTHTSSIAFLAVKPFERLQSFQFKLFRSFNMIPANAILSRFLAITCSNLSPFRRICEQIYYLIMGRNPEEMEPDRLGMITGHFPDASSIKQASHFVQSMISDEFAQYDYYKGNMKVYGTERPPLYNLSAVATPIYAFYGDKDAFAHLEDVEKLLNRLPNVRKKILVKNFAHYDFLAGKNAVDKVYKETLKIFNENL